MRFAFWRRKQRDEELKEEIQAHLTLAEHEEMEAGRTRKEAQFAARYEFGNVSHAAEVTRDIWGWRWFADLVQDVRYGLRMLRKNIGFTTVAVATLALGIGASTAIFSAVNPILFKSLPYPQAARILMVWDSTQGRRSDVTFHTYRELVARSQSMELISVFEAWQPTMTGPVEPERLDGQNVSANYFRALGVSPAFGRDFNSADDRFNGPKVVILGDGLWKRRFGGDPAIIGKLVTLDGNQYFVAGVMPSNFENVLAPPAEIWSPTQYDEHHIADFTTTEWGHHLRMIARLRSGFTTDQALREATVIAKTPVPDFPRAPWASLRSGFIVDSLQESITRGVKPALLAILGAVMLVLLIACVNVTNLLLARGAQRRGEFAVRAALGAARTRMIRQLLTESVLLAILGGVFGMIVAQFGVRALVALSPPELPRIAAIGLDGSVFAFTLGVTTLIGLMFGLIPALYASRSDLQVGLQLGSRRTAGGHQLTRRVLVIAEVALTLVLLVSAGLLLHSLQHLFAVAPGFDSAHVITMQVQTSGRRFEDAATTHRFFDDALEAVRHVPGVASAAFSRQLPLNGDLETYGARFEKDQPGIGFDVFRYGITPGYFETMKIPLLHGRLINSHDVAGAPFAVDISESLAKREFPNQDPIGQRVHVGNQNLPWYTIVGVVGDVKQTSLALSQSDEVYMNEAQWYFADDAMWLVVRTSGEGSRLVPALKQAIWSVDKDQPIVRFTTMDALLAASAGQRRFALIIFEVFACASLLLAAVGIYGVLSGSVTERMREIGVRVALGASRGNILTLIIRQGLTLAALGIAIGIAVAVAATQAIITLLFGISRFDPITYAGVIALLIGVSLIACWVPAWRAARVDPSITLRAE